MLLAKCCIWCMFFLCLAAGYLEISELDSDELTCSEALSDCSVRDDWPLSLQDEASLHVHDLNAHFKLCCENGTLRTLCIVIDIEVNLEKELLDEDHSVQREEDYDEEATIPKAKFVKACYLEVNHINVCKRVEFSINNMTKARQQHAKIGLVIAKPSGVSFGSQVVVYTNAASPLRQHITAPSLEEVCPHNMPEHAKECHVPWLSSKINPELNRVELRLDEPSDDPLSMCVQYERDGKCQKWNDMSIPLYSVTPCTCFQAWIDNNQRSTRFTRCPYRKTDSEVQKNVWQNISVSLVKGQLNHFGSMLWWNLSAPCRLSGEAWLGGQGIRQQLSNGTWRQNIKGLWERLGVFEDLDTELPPCVMVKVEGMMEELGPFCLKNTKRGPWGLLLACSVLLACLTVLIILYLLQGSVKKWAWSCHHSGFVNISEKTHVVLVSPPELDEYVSKSVSQLGSLLASHSFSVCVDQWNREQQCIMGPVPWLHSQLLELKQRRGGRVLLVLTQKALDIAEEWTRKEAARTTVDDKSATKMESPNSELFVTCLRLIHGLKQAGTASEIFVLVSFDSKVWKDIRLPELFQGLPWFRLPSQTQALLTGLSVCRPKRRLRTKRRRDSSDQFRGNNSEEVKLQNVQLN